MKFARMSRTRSLVASLAAVLIGLGLTGASAVQAATVFEGTSDAIFTDSDFGSPANVDQILNSGKTLRLGTTTDHYWLFTLSAEEEFSAEAGVPHGTPGDPFLLFSLTFAKEGSGGGNREGTATIETTINLTAPTTSSGNPSVEEHNAMFYIRSNPTTSHPNAISIELVSPVSFLLDNGKEARLSLTGLWDDDWENRVDVWSPTVSGQTVHVLGQFTIVPLPAAVWGGIVLLGGLGTARVWRRRRSVA
jgi:hypothetical protein